ncbi:MAG: hypothetical protein CL610_15665 [Anaerolineaceae bacterium]|nr:hypothetical protein [Anaerolineaceae bacterium]
MPGISRQLVELQVGELYIDAVDRGIQFVLDAEGNVRELIRGSRFCGLLVNFACLQALCYNILEADLYLSLEGQANLGLIPTLQDVTIPNTEQRMLGGSVAIEPEVTGWVVFEVPEGQEPGVLRVEPYPLIEAQTPVTQSAMDSVFPES